MFMKNLFFKIKKNKNIIKKIFKNNQIFYKLLILNFKYNSESSNIYIIDFSIIKLFLISDIFLFFK